MAVCWHADYVQEPPIHLEWECKRIARAKNRWHAGSVTSSTDTFVSRHQRCCRRSSPSQDNGASEGPLFHLTSCSNSGWNHRSFFAPALRPSPSSSRYGKNTTAGPLQIEVCANVTRTDELRSNRFFEFRSTITQRWNPLFTLRHERDGVLVSFVRRCVLRRISTDPLVR